MVSAENRADLRFLGRLIIVGKVHVDATHGCPTYGVDAPGVLIGLSAGAIASFTAAGVAFAHRWRIPGWMLFVGGLYTAASAGSFAHTTLRGKRAVWREELSRLPLSGTEQVLDLGCG